MRERVQYPSRQGGGRLQGGGDGGAQPVAFVLLWGLGSRPLAHCEVEPGVALGAASPFAAGGAVTVGRLIDGEQRLKRALLAKGKAVQLRRWAREPAPTA